MSGRKVVTVILLFGLFFSAVGYAQDKSSVAEDCPTASIKRLEEKMERILDNQEKILAELDFIKAELHKVKIRTRR